MVSLKDMFKKHRQDFEHSCSQLLFCHQICSYYLLEKLDLFLIKRWYKIVTEQLLWLKMTLLSKKASYEIEKHSRLRQNIWYFVKIKRSWKLTIWFCYFWKKIVFCFFWVCFGDSFFAQVGLKNGNFWRF